MSFSIAYSILSFGSLRLVLYVYTIGAMDFPCFFVCNALLKKICAKCTLPLGSYILFPWEASAIQDFIITSWDYGAKRTFYAYYAHDRDWQDAEKCLALYYWTYYDEASHTWRCNNPSAAAVHTVRKCSW
jgi:hypothetical protein